MHAVAAFKLRSFCMACKFDLCPTGIHMVYTVLLLLFMVADGVCSCCLNRFGVQVCDDSQRQLLMARITAHLHQLKKLTYGKHIVARVEKLLVAGNAAASQQVHSNVCGMHYITHVLHVVGDSYMPCDLCSVKLMHTSKACSCAHTAIA